MIFKTLTKIMALIKSSDILNAAAKDRTRIKHSQVHQRALIFELSLLNNHHLHKRARYLNKS